MNQTSDMCSEMNQLGLIARLKEIREQMENDDEQIQNENSASDDEERKTA